jgi:exosortase F-associated protein
MCGFPGPRKECAVLPIRNNQVRRLLVTFAVLALAAVYLFQQFDFSGFFNFAISANAKFILNRTIRFLVNDAACLLIIAAVFNESSYLRLASIVFAVEFFVLLPLYFAVKLSLEGDAEISSPFLSQFHRMIVNPLLMVVLIAGMLYQRLISSNPQK